MSFNFFKDKFNEIVGSPKSPLESIKNSSDRAVATDFVKFVCAISENARPLSVEVKRTMENGQYVLSCRFPKGTLLKWISERKSESKGIGEMADVNDLVFDDCCIAHEKNCLLVELTLNKISAPHFHSHHSVKMKTARKNLVIIGDNSREPETQKTVNNFDTDVSETSGNSETFRFNDIPLGFITNQFDRMNVENFSRWGRVFAEGQYRADMEVSQSPKGTYCISLLYPENSFFGWNRLAYFPEIQPFLFENLNIIHTENNLILRIFVRNSERRLFVNQSDCEMIMLTVRRKRHRHLPNLSTEIIYNDNNDSSSDNEEEEDEDEEGHFHRKEKEEHKYEIKNGLRTEKYRKRGK